MKPRHPRPANKADETPLFQEFWKVWQTVKSEYDGRGLARDAFFRHVWWKGADPQDLVDGAKFYASGFKPSQFRLLAQNWMDRGIYEDDAEKWRAMQERAEQSRQSSANVVQMPERRVKTKFMRDWEALHGKDYFEHYDEQKRRAGE